MRRCPKCGCTRIHGPRYRPPGSLIKAFGNPKGNLEYQCAQCGYVTYGPILDAVEEAEPHNVQHLHEGQLHFTGGQR